MAGRATLTGGNRRCLAVCSRRERRQWPVVAVEVLLSAGTHVCASGTALGGARRGDGDLGRASATAAGDESRGAAGGRGTAAGDGYCRGRRLLPRATATAAGDGYCLVRSG